MLGVAAAIYLEEYAGKNWLTNLIEINISNLAGVPSIIYGLMALSLFGVLFHLHRTVLVGGMTLAPIVILITLPVLIGLFSRRHVSVERRDAVAVPAE